MSVNNTVRRARCDCDGAAWLPVRNSSIPVGEQVGIAEPGRVILAVDLEQLRTGNVVGEVPSQLHRKGVVARMNDKGWRGDRRQDRPNVVRNTASTAPAPSPGWRSCAPALRAGGSTGPTAEKP